MTYRVVTTRRTGTGALVESMGEQYRHVCDVLDASSGCEVDVSFSLQRIDGKRWRFEFVLARVVVYRVEVDGTTDPITCHGSWDVDGLRSLDYEELAVQVEAGRGAA